MTIQDIQRRQARYCAGMRAMERTAYPLREQKKEQLTLDEAKALAADDGRVWESLSADEQDAYRAATAELQVAAVESRAERMARSTR